MDTDQIWMATHLMRRAQVIERLLVEQIDVLETMTPQDFLQFRATLAPASGLQSVQYRELEFLSGAKDDRFVARFRALTTDEKERLSRRLAEPSLWDAYLGVLSRRGLDVGSDEAVTASLLEIARDRAGHDDLWQLAEALLNHDEAAALWRARHVQMVERQIGTKSGTGGSSGAPYLHRRLPLRYYPLLWELRDKLENHRGVGPMSEHQTAERQELLAEAAAELGGRIPVGDAESYLHGYYRHVDSSDLLAAGPRRVGGVAAAHAELASKRPQGRAAVIVRHGGEATLLPGRDVIDVVTDDMPFLVDTITMTLAAHEVTTELVVHPQLTVRRDLAGTLREVIRPLQARSGEPVERGGIAPSDGAMQLAESWSHIEASDGIADRRSAGGRGSGGGSGRLGWLDLGRRPEIRRMAGASEPGRIAFGDRTVAALAGRRALHLPRLPRVRPGARGQRPGPARRAWHGAGDPAP
jgi:tryptophan 2,3-dioxygenase